MSSAGTGDAAAAAAAAQATADAAAAAAAAGNKPWYDGVDTETVGYLQNRGWDKADAKTVALGAIKAHREAEKHLGVPADKIIRLPRDASDVQAIAELRTKLGVPADGKYDYSNVKFADGADLDEAFTTTLNAALANANVPKDKAPEVAQALVKFMESAETESTSEEAAKLVVEKETLAANWGSKFQANMITAQGGARVLGVTPEEVIALEKVVGYSRVMEMFRNVGQRAGEDKFVVSPAGGSNPGGPMTQEQAAATLAERMNDKVWTQKLMDGDMTTRREFDALTRMKTHA